MFKKSLLCLSLSLFVSQVALGDYVITSYGVPSVVRFTDAGEIVWETTTDPLSDLEYPSQVEIGPDGYVYVAQGGWGANRMVKRFDYDTGELLGNVTEITSSDQQNDLQWGYDYNGDGVDDLWVIGRSDLIAVYDGTTLGNYPGTLLDSWDFEDTEPENQNWDGGGGRGLLVGPDITGDGIGELFMAKGYNDAYNKINVWDPVALKNGAGVGARVASYPITEIRESQGIILGPDVNGDGRQDLWVASQRRNEIRTYDYLIGEELSIEKAGITELSLWFYGDPNNSDEPMYVTIANKTGAPAVVYHDDAEATQTETWTEWIIPLQSFAEQGIILTDVGTIAIGFGTTR
jgi:hypothetical protein